MPEVTTTDIIIESMTQRTRPLFGSGAPRVQPATWKPCRLNFIGPESTVLCTPSSTSINPVKLGNLPRFRWPCHPGYEQHRNSLVPQIFASGCLVEVNKVHGCACLGNATTATHIFDAEKGELPPCHLIPPLCV